jgi:cobalamin biosynthesis Mg chelatase CobN
MRLLLVMGLLALVAAPAAHAQSEAEQRAALEVFRDYAPDGRIDPCKHSAQELKRAQDNIPPDIEQYAADYPAAIAAAIDARARGACDRAAAAAASPTPTPAATAAATATAAPAKTASAVRAAAIADPPEPKPQPAAPADAAASGAAIQAAIVRSASSDAPLPVLLLGILAALLALVGLAVAASRRFGLGEDRFAEAAHAIREARWRAAATWQDFLDWVRLGR